MIRGVFHDSVDRDNLFEKSGSSWKEISGKYGGVDGCLYAPLAAGGKASGKERKSGTGKTAKKASRKGKKKGKKGKKGGSLLEAFEEEYIEAEESEDDLQPVQSHNLNLAGAFKIVGELCDEFGDDLGDGCVPDMSVYMALVAIENAGGPEIEMVWGRTRGDCPNVINCVKDDCTEPGKAIGPSGAPELTKLDDSDHYREAFDKLGYSAEEQVALMGAHTFGKMQVCAGGMNGIEHGPFCTDPKKMVPPLTSANMMSGEFKGDMAPSSPSGCIPKSGEAKECWAKVAAPAKGSLGRRRRRSGGSSSGGGSKKNGKTRGGKKAGRTKKTKGSKKSKKSKRSSSLLEAQAEEAVAAGSNQLAEEGVALLQQQRHVLATSVVVGEEVHEDEEAGEDLTASRRRRRSGGSSSSSSSARRRRRGSKKSKGGKSKGKKSKSYRKSAKLLPVWSKKLENADRHGHKSQNPEDPGHVLTTGFGDGGFWDQTPQTFDNEYFKGFADQKFSNKDNCCGHSTGQRCSRKGSPSDRLSGSKIKTNLCDMKWCRSDRHNRDHMKSLVAWYEPPHDFVKKGYRHGTVKRIIRLAGDWALLAGDTRQYVEEFANNQNAFFDAFSRAFSKVTKQGYSDGDLATCGAGGGGDDDDDEEYEGEGEDEDEGEGEYDYYEEE